MFNAPAVAYFTLQAAWHPSSPSHFAALASDNRWRLYCSSKSLLKPSRSLRCASALLSVFPDTCHQAQGHSSNVL
jgi:hypothetical protein